MPTNEELISAARMLAEHCKNCSDCETTGCIFHDEEESCTIKSAPLNWDIDDIRRRAEMPFRKVGDEIYEYQSWRIAWNSDTQKWAVHLGSTPMYWLSSIADARKAIQEYELECERARQQFAAGPGLPGPEEVYLTGIDLSQKGDFSNG